MGLFDKIKDAKSTQGGVYIAPGVYRLKVRCLKQGQARDGRNFVVAEFETLESTNPERPVGGFQSWMVMLDKRYEETALGNIKGFLSILTSTPEHEVDGAGVEMAFSAANPCEGLEIRASASNIKTKKDSDFTKVVWAPAA